MEHRHRDRVRTARLEKGWTQSRLASRCGWLQSKVSRIESGVHKELTVDDLELIVAKLGLSMADWYSEIA